MNADARALAASFDLEKLTRGYFMPNPLPDLSCTAENEPVKRLRTVLFS